MKIINAKCNNCGAELTYDHDKTMLFCPYCGTKLLIVDGDEVKTAQAKYAAYRDVELAREETEREKNRQEHEREKEKIENGENIKISRERIRAERKLAKEKQRFEKKKLKLQYKQEKERNMTEKEKENKNANRVMLGFAAASALLILFCLFMSWINIYTPESSRGCVGKQYAIVKQQFQDAGFFFVRCEAVEDLADKFLYKATDLVEKVKDISVNGNLNFKKRASFNRFAPVVIYYHIYPE